MSTTPEKRVEILVRNLRVKELANQLPTNVYPVKVGVELTRPHDQDQSFKRMRQPEYPVTVRESSHAPYVPPTTVHFQNPYEFPPKGANKWRFEPFAEGLAEIVSEVEKQYPEVSQRLYLNNLVLCEIPEEYAREVDGKRDWDRSLYEDRADFRAGYFKKRPRITDDEIQEELGPRLPGNVIKPLRLTEIKEVNAKEHRGDEKTTAASTRRKYFTSGQAERYGDNSLAPTKWDLDDQSIEKAVGQEGAEAAKSFFPTLSETDFFGAVEFTGRWVDRETFEEESVRILS